MPDTIVEGGRGRRIARLVQEACIREVCAPKPGNVNREHDFRDATLEEYLVSAVAIGPAFEDGPRLGVGQIVLRAVRESRARVRSNTNLGLVLLLAPLAKAAAAAPAVPESGGLPGSGRVRESLRGVLRSLTVEDARLVYEAIRLALPGAMGRVPSEDVAGTPSVTLLEAMEMAEGRDSVAKEYATDFEIVYGTGLPALGESLVRGGGGALAAVEAFLAILGRVPDTLIARKKGMEAARGVSRQAREVVACGGTRTPRGRRLLAELDALLRSDSNGLNPGTTADLTAAALFLALLDAEAPGAAAPRAEEESG